MIHGIRIISPGKFVYEEIPLKPGTGEDFFTTLHCGVSKGTEGLIFQGRLPKTVYGSKLTPHQIGELPFSVVPGYSNVSYREDQYYFSLRPHISGFYASPGSLWEIPRSIPPKRAILAANMETALNAVWDASVSHGQRIMVVGLGTVGALIGYLCANTPGVDCVAVDTNPEKKKIACSFGLGFLNHIPQQFDPDIIFHVTGKPDSFQSVVAAAQKETRIIEVGLYADEQSPHLDMAKLHFSRIHLIYSQVSLVSNNVRQWFDSDRRMKTVFGLLSDSVFDVLINSSSQANDSHYDEIFADPNVLTHCLDF